MKSLYLQLISQAHSNMQEPLIKKSNDLKMCRQSKNISFLLELNWCVFEGEKKDWFGYEI